MKFSPILKPGFNVNTTRLKIQISNGYRKVFWSGDKFSVVGDILICNGLD
jgi:hypothetical protein